MKIPTLSRMREWNGKACTSREINRMIRHVAAEAARCGYCTLRTGDTMVIASLEPDGEVEITVTKVTHTGEAK